MYDVLVVGAGISGCTCARRLADAGYHVLLLEQRPAIGGNCAVNRGSDGVDVHTYGAHIWHTSNEKVQEFMSRFTEWYPYKHQVIAVNNGNVYHLPFNMNTFEDIWGKGITVDEAKEKIKFQSASITHEPRNLEEKAISLVGVDVYKRLIKGYTEKQWGMECRELAADIITRLPLRFEYNNDYFNDKYQGLPLKGYNNMFMAMLDHKNITVYTNTKFDISIHRGYARRIIYTGAIDEIIGDRTLPWRSCYFESIPRRKSLSVGKDYPVVNYTDCSVRYTRTIEHANFRPDLHDGLETRLVTFEFPASWHRGLEKFYPINCPANDDLANDIAEEARPLFGCPVYYCGRLATYKYLDMDKSVAAALDLIDKVVLPDLKVIHI